METYVTTVTTPNRLMAKLHNRMPMITEMEDALDRCAVTVAGDMLHRV